MAYIAKQDFSEILNGDYIECIYVEGKTVKAKKIIIYSNADGSTQPEYEIEVLGTYTSNRHAQNALTTFMNILNGNHYTKKGGK